VALRVGLFGIAALNLRGGGSPPRLNTDGSPIANKYRQGKMKRTLKRELKAFETAYREANVTGIRAASPQRNGICTGYSPSLKPVGDLAAGASAFTVVSFGPASVRIQQKRAFGRRTVPHGTVDGPSDSDCCLDRGHVGASAGIRPPAHKERTAYDRNVRPVL